MTALTTRRPSLCLFCSFAAYSRPQRSLLPHIRKAHRSLSGRRWDKGGERDEARRIDTGRGAGSSADTIWPRRGRSVFNPLKFDRFGTSNNIEKAVGESLEKIRRQISEPEWLDSLSLTQEAFEQEWASFTKYIGIWIKRASPEIQTLIGDRRRGKSALETRLRYLFYAQTYGDRFTKAEVENQKELANLRYPAEWFPQTRALPRTVHLHVGPTNSGKTYHALKRLEAAESGIYLGPLRLLAHEVYTRLNAKGRPCALITGEEQRVPEGTPKMWSCTVEMAPLNQPLEVAVIDEIQMINHNDRGWAWTQAFLGLQAKEVHLCGEARTVPLMRELCALVGDKVVVHEYERLTPLKVADRSLNGRLGRNLQKGDCIVSFSVLGIHSLRKTIENSTGKKCAIVYGSLPPETRAQQAKLFNDPDNDYDFLVASDAIGMGLNLSIKRVIFESTMKNNGTQLVPLAVSEVKQIAGRAGRYRTAHQAVTQDQEKIQQTTLDSSMEPVIGLDDTNPEADYSSRVPPDSATVGYATTLEDFDYPYLKRCMEREPDPIKTAGLFPPSLIVERFASYFPPGTPFSYILLRLHEICEIHPRFHLCALKDQLAIADTIHPVKNLSIQERIMICAAPTNSRDEGERKLLRTMAKCIADNESGELLDLPIPLEILDEPPSAERKYLYNLEQLHKSLVLYLWLTYRFPNVFTTRSLAVYAKQLVEDAIEKTLKEFSFTEQRRKRLMKQREQAMKHFEDDRDKSSAELAGGAATSASSSTMTEAGASKADKVPQAVEDVMKEEQLSAPNESTTDDVDEYPSPELEAEKPNVNAEESEIEPESVDELDALHQQQSQEVQGQGKGPAHPPVDLTSENANAAQPRL